MPFFGCKSSRQQACSTRSSSLRPFHLTNPRVVRVFFTELDVTPNIVGLCNQELHIIFTTRRDAADAAVTLWHFSKYTLTLEIKGVSMTFLEVSSYAMENACRMRITTLSRVDELLSETLLEDIARMLSDRTFTVACSPNAGEIVVFLRNNDQKKAISEKSSCGKLNLGGVPWYVVTSLGTDRQCTHREIELEFTQTSFRRYLDFARTKTEKLSKDVHDALRRYNQVNEPYCRKRTTRRLEILLQKVSYERTKRSLTPKHGEEMDASDEKLRNEIWDSLERDRSEIEIALGGNSSTMDIDN